MEAYNDFTFRFLKTIESLGLSDYKVWNALDNLSKATMSKIRRGICGVSMNTLQEFCQSYPNVNANYILTGRGNMFLSDEGQNINKDLEKEQNVSNEVSKAMLDVINEQKKEIDKLIKLTNILLDKLPNDEPMLENKKID